MNIHVHIGHIDRYIFVVIVIEKYCLRINKTYFLEHCYCGLGPISGAFYA